MHGMPAFGSKHWLGQADAITTWHLTVDTVGKRYSLDECLEDRKFYSESPAKGDSQLNGSPNTLAHVQTLYRHAPSCGTGSIAALPFPRKWI